MASKHLHRFHGVALLGSTLGLAALCASGCSGSAKVGASADSKTGADANADANFDVEGTRAWDQVEESQSEAETSASAEPSSPSGAQDALDGKLVLIGARHDVTVKAGSPTPCQCLSVVLGQPDDPNLVWKNGPPKTNQHEQIILGLSSKGIACTEQGTGASYMGHIEEGPSVIVTVESFVEGVPLTEGAILPLPKEGGQIYIQPHGKIPYGKGLDGQARCAVGTGK
jgi:hypothetical protein